MASSDDNKPFDDWKGLVAEFKQKKIPAFLPDEREYEASTATANLLYRFTRPHLVVEPESWTEVLAIVDRTNELKLHGKLTVKCGGHSYTGFSTVDKGILVDLGRMNKVEIKFTDKNSPTPGKPDVAIIQAGARWGNVYRSLVRDDCRGYVVNGGRCPSVGVSGFILGGGLSPFGRGLGMGSDTLLSATIITLENGKAVKLDVSKDHNPDLFWALRGGGSSAFGIVTEFRMKVCKLKNPDTDHGVSACRYVWFPQQTWKDIPIDKEQLREEAKAKQDAELMKTMDAFYAAPWPDEMTIDSNWMLNMGGSDKGKLGIRFTIYYDGPDKDCDALFGKYIVDPHLRDEFQKRTIPEPTTRFLHETLFLMWEEEARLALPRTSDNKYQLWCSFVFTGDAKNMQEVIRIGKAEQDEFEKQFKNDKAELWFTYIHSGGQTPNMGNNSTSSYPWREGVFQTSILLQWTEKWLEKPARETILRIKQRLSPKSVHMEEHCASYVNFSDATLAVQGDPGKSYYGPNYAKLLAIKKERDPDHHFNWPWETDTQAWRELPKSYHPTEPTPAGETISLTADSEALQKAAALWTDRIAAKAWDSYELPPPPPYTELCEPSWMQALQLQATSI